MSYQKIYVHRSTGLATLAIDSNTAVGTLIAELGTTFVLDVVYHNGVVPVELAGGATGALWCKPDGQFSGPIYFSKTTWTKFQSPANGYRFVVLLGAVHDDAPTPLAAALEGKSSVPAMWGVVWSEDQIAISSTGKLPMTIGNQGWDLTVPPDSGDPENPYPLPGALALKTDLVWSLITGKPTTFVPTGHGASHGLEGSDAVSIDASQVSSGVLDVARIPVLPSQNQVASSGNLTDLTSDQQADIVKGAVVTTTDGWRWVYTGTGSKTSEASYIKLADITPEWTAVANKPATFSPSAHTHPASDITDLATAAAGSAKVITPNAQPLQGFLATTASGDVTLTNASARVQYINPNGSARNVTLPTIDGSPSGSQVAIGWACLIKNTGTGGNSIVVKNSSGVEQVRLENGDTAVLTATGAPDTWDAAQDATNQSFVRRKAGVLLTTTGVTDIFTVPGNLKFVCTGAVVMIDGVSGYSSSTLAKIQIQESGAAAMTAMLTLNSGTNTVGEYERAGVATPATACASGNIVQIKVSQASSSTLLTGTIIVEGYYQ